MYFLAFFFCSNKCWNSKGIPLSYAIVFFLLFLFIYLKYRFLQMFLNPNNCDEPFLLSEKIWNNPKHSLSTH